MVDNPAGRTSKNGASSGGESPTNLINSLANFENDENNNLIQILGVVKPSKSSQTSITSLIRGLFTKNKGLLKILHNYSKTFNDTQDINDQKQIFKSFVNEFILWIESDVLILFEKYKNCLKESDWADKAVNDSTYFNKPLMHLSNYVHFIDSSVPLIRNPYIIDQLKSFKAGCDEILSDYLDFIENSKLEDINFNNVQLFGESSKQKQYADNVCSYFKVAQIVERTRNEPLILENSKHRYHIELLLVNLNGLAAQSYNALAVLMVPEDNSPRSLMFPPFRLNELGLTFSYSKCQLVLQSIMFTSPSVSNSADCLIISFPNEDFLAHWIKKLSNIFPLENSGSPVNQNFLLKLEDSPKIKMSGLGIDTLSDSFVSQSDSIDSDSSESKPTTKTSSPFRELISSPTIDSLQVPSIPNATERSNSVLSHNSSIEGFHQPRIPQFVKTSNSNNASPTSSLKSQGSDDSYRSFKNVNTTKKHVAPSHHSKTSLPVRSIPSGIGITRDDSLESNRPVSSSAEIEEEEPVDKENQDPVVMNQKNASTPNLSKSNKEDGLYKTNNGSAIDISNFGKNHNPSFSVHRGLNEMVEKQERPKSKLFGFFKKANRSPKLALPSATPKMANTSSTKPSKSNPKSLRIDTQAPTESDSDTIPLSGASAKSTSSNISREASSNKPFTEHKNASGTAFALPSSTSTYFFKQYKKENSNSTDSIHEEVLTIPQGLKDVINDNNSIDFYISPSSPKSMKVSKWKAKYGKWEMLTISENVFLKVVVNYELHSAWLIVFKEEYDSEFDEVVDKPILLLAINDETDIMQSAALDVQIASKNCITEENMLVMIRCKSNSLGQAIVSNVKNVKGVLSPKRLRHKESHDSSIGGSKQTIVSSIMDLNLSKPLGASNSLTLTSMNSTLENSSKQTGTESQMVRDASLVSISSEDINNASILSNPENNKFLLLNNMTVRLQKQLEGHDQISNPSSWKILSMYSLSIHMISDSFSDKNYFSFELESLDSSQEFAPHKWLICDDDKENRIHRIGKAGLLVKVTDVDLFMIECKGKKEFKELYDIF